MPGHDGTQDAGALLENFLLSAFDRNELEKFLRGLPDGARHLASLPGPVTSPDIFFGALVDLLRRHGMIDARFFAQLSVARPHRSGEIGGLAIAWGIDPATFETSAHPPPGTGDQPAAPGRPTNNGPLGRPGPRQHTDPGAGFPDNSRYILAIVADAGDPAGRPLFLQACAEVMQRCSATAEGPCPEETEVIVRSSALIVRSMSWELLLDVCAWMSEAVADARTGAAMSHGTDRRWFTCTVEEETIGMTSHWAIRMARRCLDTAAKGEVLLDQHCAVQFNGGVETCRTSKRWPVSVGRFGPPPGRDGGLDAVEVTVVLVEMSSAPEPVGPRDPRPYAPSDKDLKDLGTILTDELPGLLHVLTTEAAPTKEPQVKQNLLERVGFEFTEAGIQLVLCGDVDDAALLAWIDTIALHLDLAGLEVRIARHRGSAMRWRARGVGRRLIRFYGPTLDRVREHVTSSAPGVWGKGTEIQCGTATRDGRASWTRREVDRQGILRPLFELRVEPSESTATGIDPGLPVNEELIRLRSHGFRHSLSEVVVTFCWVLVLTMAANRIRAGGMAVPPSWAWLVSGFGLVVVIGGLFAKFSVDTFGAVLRFRFIAALDRPLLSELVNGSRNTVERVIRVEELMRAALSVRAYLAPRFGSARSMDPPAGSWWRRGLTRSWDALKPTFLMQPSEAARRRERRSLERAWRMWAPPSSPSHKDAGPERAFLPSRQQVGFRNAELVRTAVVTGSLGVFLFGLFTGIIEVIRHHGGWFSSADNEPALWWFPPLLASGAGVLWNVLYAVRIARIHVQDLEMATSDKEEPADDALPSRARLWRRIARVVSGYLDVQRKWMGVYEPQTTGGWLWHLALVASYSWAATVNISRGPPGTVPVVVAATVVFMIGMGVNLTLFLAPANLLAKAVFRTHQAMVHQGSTIARAGDFLTLDFGPRVIAHQLDREEVHRRAGSIVAERRINLASQRVFLLDDGGHLIASFGSETLAPKGGERHARDLFRPADDAVASRVVDLARHIPAGQFISVRVRVAVVPKVVRLDIHPVDHSGRRRVGYVVAADIDARPTRDRRA